MEDGCKMRCINKIGLQIVSDPLQREMVVKRVNCYIVETEFHDWA